MENLDTPRRKSGRKIWLILLLAICFIVSAAAGAMLASSSVFDLKKDPILPVERENFNTQLIKARDKSTILIMGVDVRKDDTGRSDTMMIATVDPKLDRASLLSVPRDTRVRIYGYGYDKINAAFAYGGEPLAEKTVENFLGIDIDHYIVIDVNSFVKIIDAIGGIDIYVDKRMKYEDPWDDNGGLYINIFPGQQHMDGKKAVTYVRYRDSEGDIGRIQRQQKFMEACLDKIMSPAFIPRIPAVIREVADAIDTDMTFRQLLELAGALKAAQANGIRTDMVPGYPLYIDEISYWIPYVDELQYSMARLLEVDVDYKIKNRAESLAREYKDSIPSSARQIPDDADEPIGNSDYHSSYDDNSYDDYYETPRENNSYDDSSRYDDYYESPRENNSYDDSPRYDDYAETPRENNSYDDSPRYDDYAETPRENNSYDDSPRYDDYAETPRENNSYDDYSDEPERQDYSDDYDYSYDDSPTRDESARVD